MFSKQNHYKWLQTATVLFAFTLCFVVGKKLRLPILLRSPKIECSFTSDECGINQSLDQFELYQNSTFTIAGRCQYYQFAIKDNFMPIRVARFKTIFFPNLESNMGCLHVEYNVHGVNLFFFAISQKTRISQPRVLFSHTVSRTLKWQSIDIQVPLYQQESQFIFEVMCQWCMRGSKFSISRISFAWESCPNLPLTRV